MRRLAAAGLAAVVPLGLAWGYGAWRLGQPAGEPGPVVALVPGGFSRSDSPERQALALRKRVEGLLSTSATAAGPTSFPALLVWREMAYPAGVTTPTGASDGDAAPTQKRASRSRDSEPLGYLESFCRALGAPIVVGTLRINPADPRAQPFNTLVYVTPERGYEGHCDKGHLVPVVESMPRWLVTMYEGFDVDRKIARETLTQARFRAIESRRAQVRVSEGGDTAIIDGSGDTLSACRRSAQETSVVLAQVTLDSRESPYVFWGDWLAVGACTFLLIPFRSRAEPSMPEALSGTRGV
jgi:apolipoprotein N-acyltransferase